MLGVYMYDMCDKWIILQWKIRYLIIYINSILIRDKLIEYTS